MTDRAAVHFDKLITWRDGKRASEHDIDEFPRLIAEMATALRWRSEKRDDPGLPLG